jgi:hypothetical protein
MSSTKHVGELKMNQYALRIAFGGVRLIHIHRNQWEHELTNVTSTYVCSLIQARIWCHATNTSSQNPPKVRHSPTCMHISAFVWSTNATIHKSTFINGV